MQANVGGFDKAARIGIGAGLILLGLGGIGAPWTFLGILPLLTGLINWCPAYPLLGINTCKKKQEG